MVTRDHTVLPATYMFNLPVVCTTPLPVSQIATCSFLFSWRLLQSCLLSCQRENSWQLTGDLVRIDASDWYWRDALVHARLMRAVEQVPDVNAAVLLGDVEDGRPARRPVTSRQALRWRRWTQDWACLQTVNHQWQHAAYQSVSLATYAIYGWQVSPQWVDNKKTSKCVQIQLWCRML